MLFTLPEPVFHAESPSSETERLSKLCSSASVLATSLAMLRLTYSTRVWISSLVVKKRTFLFLPLLSLPVLVLRRFFAWALRALQSFVSCELFFSVEKTPITVFPGVFVVATALASVSAVFCLAVLLVPCWLLVFSDWEHRF